MPISTTYQIRPVFGVMSAVPSVSGAALAVAAADAAAVAGTDAAVVTFSKASYAPGRRGGEVASYPVSATIPATVTIVGTPRRLVEGSSDEQRPLAEMTFHVTTDVDPGAELGAPLATDDRMEWAGYEMFVIGTSIPQGTRFLTVGRIII
jgi:hypothetical protein